MDSEKITVDGYIHQLRHLMAECPTRDFIRDYRNVERFIVFCKQCDRYNANWSCPPFDFDTDEYMSGYEKIYVFGTKIVLDERLTELNMNAVQSKDISYKIIKRVRTKLDARLLEQERKYKGKAFFAGTCIKCPFGECTRPLSKSCIYPREIRYSLESFGFDIGKITSELLHTKLKWGKNGKLPEYFVLVSGIFIE